MASDVHGTVGLTTPLGRCRMPVLPRAGPSMIGNIVEATSGRPGGMGAFGRSIPGVAGARTSSHGTTTDLRCSISPNRRCAPTKIAVTAHEWRAPFWAVPLDCRLQEKKPDSPPQAWRSPRLSRVYSRPQAERARSRNRKGLLVAAENP